MDMGAVLGHAREMRRYRTHVGGPILEQGGGSNRLVAKGCKEKVLGTPTHTHLGWVCGHPLLAEDDRVCVREETAGGGRVTVRTLRTLHAVDRHGGAEAFEGLLELAHAWASRQGAAHQLQALALLLLVRWRGRRGRRLRVHRRMKKWLVLVIHSKIKTTYEASLPPIIGIPGPANHPSCARAAREPARCARVSEVGIAAEKGVVCESMATTSSLSLCRQLLRTANGFTNYNFREYALRIIREDFKSKRALSGVEAVEARAEGFKQLQV